MASDPARLDPLGTFDFRRALVERRSAQTGLENAARTAAPGATCSLDYRDAVFVVRSWSHDRGTTAGAGISAPEVRTSQGAAGAPSLPFSPARPRETRTVTGPQPRGLKRVGVAKEESEAGRACASPFEKDRAECPRLAKGTPSAPTSRLRRYHLAATALPFDGRGELRRVEHRLARFVLSKRVDGDVAVLKVPGRGRDTAEVLVCLGLLDFRVYSKIEYSLACPATVVRQFRVLSSESALDLSCTVKRQWLTSRSALAVASTCA